MRQTMCKLQSESNYANIKFAKLGAHNAQYFNMNSLMLNKKSPVWAWSFISQKKNTEPNAKVMQGMLCREFNQEGVKFTFTHVSHQSLGKTKLCSLRPRQEIGVLIYC